MGGLPGVQRVRGRGVTLLLALLGGAVGLRAQGASVPDAVFSVAPPEAAVVPGGPAGLRGGVAPAGGLGGVPAPSATEVMQAMRRAVRQDTELKGGYFLVYDADTGRVRALRPVRIRPGIHVADGPAALRILKRFRGGNPAALPKDVRRVYMACADFTDVKTKEPLDVDVWIAWGDHGPEPVQFPLHGIDGKTRFSYKDGERTRLDGP